MKLSVPLINGQLADRYGKHASGSDVKNGYPITSFPFTIEDAPAETVSFALWFLDYDAVPVGGLPWIHWNGANGRRQERHRWPPRRQHRPVHTGWLCRPATTR